MKTYVVRSWCRQDEQACQMRDDTTYVSQLNVNKGCLYLPGLSLTPVYLQTA